MSWLANINGKFSGSDDCLHQCVECGQLYWVAWTTCPNCGTSKYAKPKPDNKENGDDRTDQAK